MNKKTRKLLTWCLVVAMLVTQMLFANVAFAATKSYAGNDRFTTALAIVDKGWTKSDVAVIARGDVDGADLADALAAAPLAYANGKAPVFITEKDKLTDGIATRLDTLGVKKVFIVGGVGAVSKAVEDTLAAKLGAANVTRVSGASRVETALAVAKLVKATPAEVVLVNGYASADALSAAPVAAAKGMPILFTESKDTLSADVKAYIGTAKVYVVGGAGVVSDAVKTAVNGERVAGDDRYATNNAVLAKFAPDFTTVYVAKGADQNAIDALAGAPLAALTNSPIVFVDEANTVNAAKATLTANLKATSTVVGLGGLVTNAVLASIEALMPAAGAAVVKSAKVVNYKTVEVTLENAVRTVKPEDFTVSPELAITAATLSADGLVVTLTTAPQEEGTSYTVKAAGQATEGSVFVGLKAPNGTIVIESAEARTNTEVTVVLADAPLVELDAADFVITPSLNIVSVTTNNNVVTLKTTAQTAGTVYTLTTTAGSGSAEFTGIADIDATGIVKSVEVPNLRQLVINLTKPVVWADAQNLDNFYLGLTENEKAEIQLNSVATLGAANDWIVSAGSQKVLDDDGDPIDGVTVNYLVLEATDGALLTDLGLKYNENATVEVRNIVDANGYIHTSQGAFTLVDNKAPKASSDTVLNVEPTDTEALLNVKFDEPVSTMAANPQFRVYIDGVEVTGDAIVTDIDDTTTVAAHKVFTIDVFGYDRDEEHTIKVVGAKDLHNNVMSPNPYTEKFIIKDTEADAPVPPARVKVVDIKQIADNAFEVYFDKEDVEKYDAAAKSVTILKAMWSGTEWVDMDDSTDLTIDDTLTYTDKDGNTLSKWLVTFDADFAREDGFSYDNQKIVARTIEVKNYIADDAHGLTGDLYYAGATYKELFSFQHDTTAPVLATAKAYDVAAGQLYVSFKDSPFEGIVQAGTGILKVSMTNSKGQTFDEEVDVAGADVEFPSVAANDIGPNKVDFEAGKYVVITLPAGSSVLVDTDNDDVTDALARSAVYTVAFPQGSVKDADRTAAAGYDFDEEKVEIIPSQTDPGAIYADYHMMAAAKASIVIPKAADEATAEGLVPQTTKGLIFSGVDYRDGLYQDIAVTAVNAVASDDYFQKDENQNKIVIFFDGEVLESSALNKANYTFNGKPLSANAEVAYYKGDVTLGQVLGNKGVDGEDVGYVVITLPANSVEKSGLYTVSVAGVTNKAGKRMLPVADSVALVDNTAPVAQKLRVVGSKQLELTFDEELQFAPIAGAETNACNNFTVVVNGFKYSVDAVTLSADVKKVILTLSQDFDVNGSVANVKATVTIVKDADGNMWITDLADVPNAIRDKVKLTNN